MSRAELHLSYEPTDIWDGRLDANVVSGAFTGKGSAWFGREHLKDTFIAALRMFPLSAGKFPCIEGGFWREENPSDLEQCHLRIRIQPYNAIGAILVQVDLATASYDSLDHDPQQAVTARFLTEYAALDIFASQFEQVLDGKRESAVLYGTAR